VIVVIRYIQKYPGIHHVPPAGKQQISYSRKEIEKHYAYGAVVKA
jgi:hypothetical protein